MNKIISMIVLVLLSACGGNSSNQETVIIQQPIVQCTGNLYYPMCDNTYIRYTNQMITAAHIDYTTNEVIVDAVSTTANPRGKYLTLQNAINHCPNLPGEIFFADAWTFSNDGLPKADITNSSDALWISDYSVNGVDYLGEGDGGVVSPGEAEITKNPIAGEIINGSSIVSITGEKGCATSTISNPTFTWQYQTVRHFDVWHNFKDVWLTTIVEWHGQSALGPTYYEQAFARDIGQIALWCWEPTGDSNYYSCGNYYMAVYEGKVK